MYCVLLGVYRNSTVRERRTLHGCSLYCDQQIPIKREEMHSVTIISICFSSIFYLLSAFYRLLTCNTFIDDVYFVYGIQTFHLYFVSSLCTFLYLLILWYINSVSLYVLLTVWMFIHVEFDQYDWPLQCLQCTFSMTCIPT